MIIITHGFASRQASDFPFRSSNHFQPIIEALAVIKQHIKTPYKYFPVEVPIEGIVTESWMSMVIENVGGQKKVNRKYYELCVLQQLERELERALKCKEIWVEDSYAWRNPSEGLPPDWSNEDKRSSYYQRLNQPMSAQSFVESVRQEMITALTEFNRILPGNPHVKIYLPGNKAEKTIFLCNYLPYLEPKQEVQSGLNVIENWNGTNDFIFYGSRVWSSCMVVVEDLKRITR